MGGALAGRGWSARRVAVVLVLLAAVVATLVGVALGRRGGDGGERLRQQALIDAAGPSVCRLEELVAGGDLAMASNVFWDEVHTGAHVTAAWLGETGDRAAQARFLEAKGAVEVALPVLSPRLSEVVPRFGDAYRSALRTLGRPATADCG